MKNEKWKMTNDKWKMKRALLLPLKTTMIALRHE